MKRIKTILPLFLIITLLICPVNQAFAADDGYFSDRELLLKSIGVINADTLKDFEAPVSRIEIIAAASFLSGYDKNAVYNVSMPYSDVLPGYEEENLLRFAYGASLITPSDKILPEDNADFNFAAKTFINAMGYEIVAKAKGSYSGVGIYKDLMNGVNTKGESVTYGDFVNMLYNMLFIDYLDTEKYTNDGLEYETTSGVSVYSHNLDIYTVEGRMDATSISTVTGTLANDGCVTVDGVEYKISDNSLMLFVGNEIIGVYKDTDNKDTLICAIRNNKKELVVDAKNYISYSNYRLKYQNESGRIKTVNVNKSAVILYNGQHVTGSDYSDSLFDIKEGSITLIDNGGGYSIICINSYKNLLVKAVMSENGVYDIIDEIVSSNKIPADLQENMYISVKNEKGENVLLDDIKIGNLVTYQKSLGEKFLNIYISNTKIAGEPDSIKKSTSGVYELEYDGVGYEVTSNLPSDIKISNGTAYVCYINHFGNIGAIRYSKNSEGKLGYLLDRVQGTGLSGSDRIDFKILTGDVDEIDFTIFTGANKMLIDGKNGLKGDAAITAIDNYSKIDLGESSFKPMPIIYTVNEAGQIATVDTPHTGNDESTESLTRRYKLTDSPLLVKNMSTFNNGYTFGLKYYTSKDAMHIGYDTSNPGEYYICKYSNEKTANIELFSLGNTGGKCLFAIAESSTSSADYEDDLALIVSVTSVINERDEDVKKVKAIYEGKEKTYFTKSNSTIDFTTVKPGDITCISLDSKDRLIGIDTPVFTYSSLRDGVQYTGSENYTVNRLANSRYVTGTVHSIEYDEDSGYYYLYYFINDPSDLSILMMRNDINYFVEKDRLDNVTATVLNGAEAINKVKCYELFTNDADLVTIRYTYWVPSYSFIIRR